MRRLKEIKGMACSDFEKNQARKALRLEFEQWYELKPDGSQGNSFVGPLGESFGGPRGGHPHPFDFHINVHRSQDHAAAYDRYESRKHNISLNGRSDLDKKHAFLALSENLTNGSNPSQTTLTERPQSTKTASQSSETLVKPTLASPIN